MRDEQVQSYIRLCKNSKSQPVNTRKATKTSANHTVNFREGTNHEHSSAQRLWFLLPKHISQGDIVYRHDRCAPGAHIRAVRDAGILLRELHVG